LSGIEDMVKVGQAHYTDAAWEKNTPKTIVIFHYRPKYHEAKSKEAGEPVYEQRVFIKKITPGDTLLAYDQPATQRDFEEHPAEYEAFMNKKALQQTGIPLEKWDGLTDEQIPSFKALNIYTVEHLASLPDSAGAKIFGFIKIRKKAQEFLDAKAKSGSAKELAERDAIIKSQGEAIAAMQAQLQELATKRGPGRPRKVAVTQQ
jgi:hypothetical protein